MEKQCETAAHNPCQETVGGSRPAKVPGNHRRVRPRILAKGVGNCLVKSQTSGVCSGIFSALRQESIFQTITKWLQTGSNEPVLVLNTIFVVHLTTLRMVCDHLYIMSVWLYAFTL